MFAVRISPISNQPHYHSLALRDAPRFGVVMTLVSISKIIREAEIFNTG